MIKTSDILLNQINLDELYDFFNINTKEDLIQILSYLHKLDNNLTIFNSLPIEILKKILLDLDIDSLLLWFKSNKYLNLSCKILLDDLLRSKISIYSNMYTKDLNAEQLLTLLKKISIHMKRKRSYIRKERPNRENKNYGLGELRKYAKELGLLTIGSNRKDLIDKILEDRNQYKFIGEIL